MTNTAGHDHPADPWRSTQKHVEHLENHHKCEDGDNCIERTCAEAADLITESMECPDCRPAVPALINHIVDAGGGIFAKGIILAFAVSMAGADRKINEGIATYEKMVGSN